MVNPYSIARTCYRNQLFVLPMQLMTPFSGPYILTNYNVELVIGQPNPPINPDTIGLPGAPAWSNFPGGYTALWNNNVSYYPPMNAEVRTFPMPPWFTSEFGTIIFVATDPGTGFAQGQMQPSLTATQTGQLIALTPFNWMVLVQPPGVDASPLCGGPLIVRDAPVFT